MHSDLDMRLGIRQTPTTRVILVRHGRSTYNEKGLYQGSSDDSVLTETGRNSAYQTGLALRELAIDAIYTSPLKRTQQTAKEILTALSTATEALPPLQVADNLKEISMHYWEGLPYSYVREQFPEDYRCWQERPHQFEMRRQKAEDKRQEAEDGRQKEFVISDSSFLIEHSESSTFPVLNLYEQAQQFWQEILPRHNGQTLLLVSHGGTNRALINTALGITPTHYHVLQQCNCGLSVLSFPAGASNPAQLEALNLTTHLGKTLPKLKQGRRGIRLLLVPCGTTNPEQTQKLAQLLKDETIHFSLNAASDNCQAIEKQLLQYHPTTVQFQVLREDFPDDWQQTISARSSSEDTLSELVTGLVIAPEVTIRRFMSQVLGKGSEQLENLQLRQGAISVIHYPSPNQSPVLQVVNLGLPIATMKRQFRSPTSESNSSSSIRVSAKKSGICLKS